MDNQRFAARLKQLMEKENISKQDIVKHFDISTSAINSWLSGKKIPKWDLLFHLADYFHVSLSVLLGIDELIS